MSAIPFPGFPLKNRAAARWLYVVTSEASILGKPSALLISLHRRAYIKIPQRLESGGSLLQTGSLKCAACKKVCLNAASPAPNECSSRNDPTVVGDVKFTA